METNSRPTKAQGFIVIAAALLCLAGCGSNKESGSTDLLSRATNNDTSDSSKAWASCNASASKKGGFEISLAAYTEGGKARNDLMWARLTSIPSTFKSKNYYFQMFRWQGNGSGSTYLDPTALSFTLVDPDTGSTILTKRKVLRWSDIKTLASQRGTSDPESFFEDVLVLIDLNDPTAAFDALMTVLYKTDNSASDTAQTLLPVFNANPSDYATDMDGSSRNQALRDIHPFKDKEGGGWSKNDYQTWANSLCSVF